MTRILTPPGVPDAPDLDPEAVAAFFEARASRIEEVGPVKAVIYQDKSGDLAERRDQTEADCLMPRLALDGSQRLLDIGCGTGRWTARIAPLVTVYHGIDFNESFLVHARGAHAGLRNCRFTCVGAEAISADALGEADFDRVLCAGVSIYLNGDQLARMYLGIAAVAADECRIVFREPVGISQRLTLSGHYSDELEHEYHAIYRTEDELLDAMREPLLGNGFELIDLGDLFEEHDGLNNRAETRQRRIVLERRR
jgi:SAM-dependent methyltransferase